MNTGRHPRVEPCWCTNPGMWCTRGEEHAVWGLVLAPTQTPRKRRPRLSQRHSSLCLLEHAHASHTPTSSRSLGSQLLSQGLRLTLKSGFTAVRCAMGLHCLCAHVCLCVHVCARVSNAAVCACVCMGARVCMCEQWRCVPVCACMHMCAQCVRNGVVCACMCMQWGGVCMREHVCMCVRNGAVCACACMSLWTLLARGQSHPPAQTRSPTKKAVE